VDSLPGDNCSCMAGSSSIHAPTCTHCDSHREGSTIFWQDGGSSRPALVIRSDSAMATDSPRCNTQFSPTSISATNVYAVFAQFVFDHMP
jgi:hypothetical protein